MSKHLEPQSDYPRIPDGAAVYVNGELSSGTVMHREGQRGYRIRLHDGHDMYVAEWNVAPVEQGQ